MTLEEYVSIARARLEITTASDAPSPPSSEPEDRGPKLIDRNLHNVLNAIWQCTVTTKSDFARLWADYIAMAASMGLITTQVHRDVYSREWQVTAAGLRLLEVEIKEDGEEAS